MTHVLLFLAKLWTAAIILVCAFTVTAVGTLSIFLPTLGIEQRVITSESMMPTYYVGDRVWYSSPTGGDLIPGRAVGIQFDDDFYTHRVVSVDPVTGLATLKGDGQDNFDVTKVTQADVAGVPFHVTTDAPTLWVMEMLEDRWVIAGLSVLGILTLFGWVIRKGALDARDKREHDEAWARIRTIDDAVVAAGIAPAPTSSAPDRQALTPSRKDIE